MARHFYIPEGIDSADVSMFAKTMEAWERIKADNPGGEECGHEDIRWYTYGAGSVTVHLHQPPTAVRELPGVGGH